MSVRLSSVLPSLGLAISMLVCSPLAHASESALNDSVSSVLASDASLQVSWPQVAVPAAAFAISAVTVRAHWGIRFRNWAQHGLAREGHNHTAVDNYLQYLPMASPWVLNLCGYRGAHGWVDLAILTGLSFATFNALNYGAKAAFHERRPDSGARNSFPSGHTGTAFLGAELLRREYWDRNKLVALSGYLMATAVGYLRVYNNRHWINDVVGGAAIGYLSTTLAYWLYPRLFGRWRQTTPSTAWKKDTALHVSMLSPSVGPDGLGLALALTF